MAAATEAFPTETHSNYLTSHMRFNHDFPDFSGHANIFELTCLQKLHILKLLVSYLVFNSFLLEF